MTPLKQTYQKLKEFLNREIKVRESLPPYLLIGILWWATSNADDQSRARDLRRGEIELAIQQYENATEQYEDQVALRKDCIDDVNGRNNTINNLAFIESFIRTIDEAAADEFRRQYQAQPNNQPKSIELDCIAFPVPQRPTIPFILIEEGIISEDTPTPQAD